MGKRSEAEQRGDALRQLEELGRASVPNACVLMELHHHTLRRYIADGAVEAFWVGKRPWVMAEEIQRYLFQGKRSASSS